jgi:hypothetical protein
MPDSAWHPPPGSVGWLAGWLAGRPTDRSTYGVLDLMCRWLFRKAWTALCVVALEELRAKSRFVVLPAVTLAIFMAGV